jgi:hypothetical protein
VLGDLAVQHLDAAGQGTQTGHGGGGLDIPGGPLPQPCTGADQARSGQAAKPVAEDVWRGDHQRMQLALRVGGGLDRGAARGQPRRQRRAVSRGAGLGELVAAQGLTGSPGGVQGIRAGAVAAGGSLGPVQLHHLLSVGGQEPGQAGA